MDCNFSWKARSCHILVKQEQTFPINIAELCLWHLCLSNWFKICEGSELEAEVVWLTAANTSQVLREDDVLLAVLFQLQVQLSAGTF